MRQYVAIAEFETIFRKHLSAMSSCDDAGGLHASMKNEMAFRTRRQFGLVDGPDSLSHFHHPRHSGHSPCFDESFLDTFRSSTPSSQASPLTMSELSSTGEPRDPVEMLDEMLGRRRARPQPRLASPFSLTPEPAPAPTLSGTRSTGSLPRSTGSLPPFKELLGELSTVGRFSSSNIHAAPCLARSRPSWHSPMKQEDSNQVPWRMIHRHSPPGRRALDIDASGMPVELDKTFYRPRTDFAENASAAHRMGMKMFQPSNL